MTAPGRFPVRGTYRWRGSGVIDTIAWRAFSKAVKYVPTPRLIVMVGESQSSGEAYILEEELWARQGNDRTAALYIMETLPF